MDEARIAKRGKSLDTLATEINAEHRAFAGAFRKTLEHGIRAGELLVEAKGQCKRGEWLGWLEANFEGAPRTAQEYMRLFNHRDEIRAKYADSAQTSISGALKELAAPREERHLGLEWERAHKVWNHALGTAGEAERFAVLRELDKQVRPSTCSPLV